jgi:hypothetical protein
VNSLPKLIAGFVSLIDMRYWTYFAAKVTFAAMVLSGMLALLNRAWPPERHFFAYVPPRFGYNLWFTLTVLIWFLFCAGALYLVIWDQRYRCRVCLRRLMMPVATGSWSRMLQFGRPRIEYICPYGHGTLREAELQICGLENPEWKAHSGGLWEELESSAKEPVDRP